MSALSTVLLVVFLALIVAPPTVLLVSCWVWFWLELTIGSRSVRIAWRDSFGLLGKK